MLENVVEAPVERAPGSPRAMPVVVRELYQFSRLVRTFGNGKWIFRGHADKSWSLKTSLERRMVGAKSPSTNPTMQKAINSLLYKRYEASDEAYAVEVFKRLAQKSLPNLAHDVEWLAAMQHYGTCTRLLDFSRSMYVALYFAMESEMRDKDAAIYAIKFDDLIHNTTIRDDLIKIQAEDILRRHRKKDAAARERDMSFVSENYFKNNCLLQDSLIKLADRHIENSNGKQMGVIPISAPGVNERLVAQSGLFLMPRNFKPFEENLAASLEIDKEEVDNPKYKYNFARYPGNKNILKNAALIKILIDRELFKAMRNMLDQANVSALNLFPGLEGIAKSIRYSESLFER